MIPTTINQHDLECEYSRKYGRVYGTYTFLSPILNVSDADTMGRIMVKDFKYFPQRFADGTQAHPTTKLFLTVVNGEEWKRQREAMTPSFSPAKIKHMFTLMKSCVESMEKAVKKKIRSRSSAELDTRSLYGKFSLDVIAKCCFATDTRCHESTDSIFFKHAHLLFEIKLSHILKMVLYPLWFKNWTQFTTCNTESLNFFTNVSKELIYRRRDQDSPEKGADFFQSLIEASQSESTSEVAEGENSDLNLYRGISDEGGPKKNSTEGGSQKSVTKYNFSDEHIIANSVIFFGAGYETTGSLMSFASYVLATNPDIQEKLYQEIKEAQGKNGGSSFDYDTINNLEYLDNFVSEALRLYTPIPRMPRVTHADYVLEYDEGRKRVKLPKGTVLNLAFVAVNRDPEYWKEPMTFDPDRFSKENQKNINPFTYVPFGAGPRYCIGMRFALLEIKLAFASQISKFKFSKSSRTDQSLKYARNMFLLQTKEMFVDISNRE